MADFPGGFGNPGGYGGGGGDSLWRKRVITPAGGQKPIYNTPGGGYQGQGFPTPAPLPNVQTPGYNPGPMAPPVTPAPEKWNPIATSWDPNNEMGYQTQAPTPVVQRPGYNPGPMAPPRPMPPVQNGPYNPGPMAPPMKPESKPGSYRQRPTFGPLQGLRSIVFGA